MLFQHFFLNKDNIIVGGGGGGGVGGGGGGWGGGGGGGDFDFVALRLRQICGFGYAHPFSIFDKQTMATKMK